MAVERRKLATRKAYELRAVASSNHIPKHRVKVSTVTPLHKQVIRGFAMVSLVVMTTSPALGLATTGSLVDPANRLVSAIQHPQGDTQVGSFKLPPNAEQIAQFREDNQDQLKASYGLTDYGVNGTEYNPEVHPLTMTTAQRLSSMSVDLPVMPLEVETDVDESNESLETEPNLVFVAPSIGEDTSVPVMGVNGGVTGVSLTQVSQPIMPTYEAVQTQTHQLFDVPLAEDLQRHIIERSHYHGVDPHLMMALAQVESTFRPYIISQTNDWGLFQININNHGWLRDIGITDLLDPYQNTEAALIILGDLLNRHSTRNALTAYNRGEGGMRRYVRGNPSFSFYNRVMNAKNSINRI